MLLSFIFIYYHYFYIIVIGDTMYHHVTPPYTSVAPLLAAGLTMPSFSSRSDRVTPLSCHATSAGLRAEAARLVGFLGRLSYGSSS